MRSTLRDEPATLPPGLGITAEERAYWFYQPLKRLAPPAFAPADRVRTPDRRLRAREAAREGAELQPGRRPRHADPPGRVRPHRAAAHAEGDRRLLGRHVARRLRESCSTGCSRRRPTASGGAGTGSTWPGTPTATATARPTPLRPFAWRYRDYVIRALNADKPLDRFVTEQLAGDELVPRPWTNLKPEQIDLLAATGFLRTAPDGTASGGTPADAEQVVTDTLKIVDLQRCWARRSAAPSATTTATTRFRRRTTSACGPSSSRRSTPASGAGRRSASSRCTPTPTARRPPRSTPRPRRCRPTSTRSRPQPFGPRSRRNWRSSPPTSGPG